MKINFNVSGLDISYTFPEDRVINDSINYIKARFINVLVGYLDISD